MKRYLLLTTILLAACSPNLSPEEGYSVHVVRLTYAPVTVTAQSVQAMATQSANELAFSHVQTLAAQPAANTATALALATQVLGLKLAEGQGTAVSARATVAYTETQIALVKLESAAQRTLAENNRAIADSVHGGELWRSAIGFLVGIVVFGFGVLIAWCVLQLCAYTLNTRKDRERSDKWKRIFEAERLMVESGVVQTSAGSISAVTLAEKHVALYQTQESTLQQWRALAMAYVQSAIQLSRTGETRYPFSEPVAVGNALITHPDTGEVWREGHRRLMGWLIDECGVMARTGKGGKTDWASEWSLERFEREFSRTPLPSPPDGPIPHAKILGEVERL